MKIFSRYFTAGISFIVMFSVGVFYAWSLFRLELLTFFPTWSASETAMNFTIYITFFCSGGLLGGKLATYWGRRMTLRISALLILLGGVLFSSIQSFQASAALLMVYLSYGIIFGVGSGIAYNVIISGVGELFPQNSGLVSGILLTGFGFGSLFLGSLIDKAATHWNFFRATPHNCQSQ